MRITHDDTEATPAGRHIKNLENISKMERLRQDKDALQRQLNEALEREGELKQILEQKQKPAGSTLARQIMAGIARPNDEPPGR